MAECAAFLRDYAPPRDYGQLAEARSRARASSERAGTGRADREGGRGGRGGFPGDAAGSARLVAAVALVAAASLVLFFMVALPIMELGEVEYRGLGAVDPVELAAYGRLPPKAYWFNVDLPALELSLGAHPAVLSVEVERVFPDRVIAVVTERAPVAVVYARDAAGRLEAHCVDRNGVVFCPARTRAGSELLPVLSGMEIRGLSYGMELGEPFASILRSLADVGSAEPGLVTAISELRVVSAEGLPAELLVYPVDCRVPVRMRPVLNAGLLKSMLLVLDVVRGEGLAPSIRELDLRTDTFIYRTKEAVSG